MLHLPNGWTWALAGLLLVLTVSLAVFFDTWSGIFETWARSKTYTHGFVIAPISLWLLGSRRHYYLRLCPVPSYWALVGVLVNGFIWLGGDLSHILIIKQLAVVGMLISGFWGVLGNAVAFSMSFPLGFLFFMVPMGEELIPWLVEFTTSFTVNMIRLTGLPVYREGHFFTLTSGNWSVVEACSGISYLIASITLGFVFAYLNYAYYWKRALFMVLSCLVPIIANGFRAYLIVMIGHLSGMTLAVGADHLVYGGVFFGLVMLLLFYLGSFWRDPPFTPLSIVVTKPTKKSISQRLPATVMLVLSFGAWPLLSAWLLDKQAVNGLPDYVVNAQLQGWKVVDNPQWQWLPQFERAVEQKMTFYTNGKQIIGMYHTSFGKEEQGAELVNSENMLITGNDVKRFHRVLTGILHVQFGNNFDLIADTILIKEPTQRILAMDWYQIGGQVTANRFLVKWRQLVKRLTGDSAPELKVVLWTATTDDDRQPLEDALKNFLADWVRHNNLSSLH